LGLDEQPTTGCVSPYEFDAVEISKPNGEFGADVVVVQPCAISTAKIVDPVPVRVASDPCMLSRDPRVVDNYVALWRATDYCKTFVE